LIAGLGGNVKINLAIIILVVFSTAIAAQQSDMKMTPTEKPVELLPGLGSLHHPTSTKNPGAQRFFDQGFRMIYGFNHEEAVRSFKRAEELDPQMAMAWWGVAIALGPNINQDVDPDREKAAYDAVRKALSLTKNAPANERDYVEALVIRYSNDPKADLKKLAVDYKNAMGELMKKYPDDLDAATLYAESMMDLHPWQLWSADGKPAEGTEEIVAVLESVLRRNPNHPGAIHYYIHAVEASPHPERALAYAPRLPQLMPMAGHLVHMPAHIYERVGDYQAAARSNTDAAAADEAYFKATGLQGFYSMYYVHNLDFLAVAHSMQGSYRDAMDASNKLVDFTRPMVKNMPMFEPILAKTILMWERFQRWDEIMKQPQPDASQPSTLALWDWARAMAFASRGNFGNAESEHKAFLITAKSVPADSMLSLNPTSKILTIADDVLHARIAEARHDHRTALEFFNKGVKDEDALAYDEPPQWFHPVRESLGGFLLRRGNYAEAEKVFRADLERNRHSGRSLYGLMESLKRQKKGQAAAAAQRDFESAWKNADTKLSVADL
jgi:tetratricopeptide (TPR) repeat protein